MSVVFLFFFSECSLYNGQGFSKGTGHFTQVVWKSCETYGMATQTCNIPGKDLYQVIYMSSNMGNKGTAMWVFNCLYRPLRFRNPIFEGAFFYVF